MKRFVSLFTAATLCMTTAVPSVLIHAEETAKTTFAEDTVSGSALDIDAPVVLMAAPSAPPSGGQPGGAPGGSSAVTSWSAVNTYTSDASEENGTYTSTGTDENAVLVQNGASVTLTNPTVTRTSSDSTGGDNASFYGVGAAVLTTDGTTYIDGGSITTDSSGGAGVFSYSNGTTYIQNTTINTSQNTSGGIHAAGGGTLYAWDVNATTQGGSAAAIRSDRGGGTMVVDGGTYTSNGSGSPAIYCTADITVNDAELNANGSEGICIEGLNSLNLFDCDLTSKMPDDSRNDTSWSIILYQSMSGDSEVGTSTFNMVGGSVTSTNGGLIYTTNTDSKILMQGVDVNMADDAEFFLQATGNQNQRGWGSTGSNGADCDFTAIAQEMNGDIIYDCISDLDFYMTNGSTLTGKVYEDNSWTGTTSGSGTASVYIDSSSKWVVTGDSSVDKLYNAGSIVDASGNTVTVKNTSGTVLVQGTSSYTVTVGSYSTSVDLSGAQDAPEYSDYAVTNPFTGETGSQETPSETIDKTTDTTDKTETETIEKVTVEGEETSIVLSDSGITVGGVSLDGSTAVNGVYTANDIICVTDDNEHGYYYTEGSGSEYDLSADEIHTAEEAAKNTVVHITQPGKYRISGTLSAGQIAVELEDTASAAQSVELILDNANVTCDVAPAVIFYSVYEPYDGTSVEEAAIAGAIVTIADGSVNTINGSHVGKTFKDETYAKKKYKFDGAFYSKQSMIIQPEGENWGTLNINADNEGLDSELHLTINGGNINIVSKDDGINVNEDDISCFTMNDGYLHVSAGVNGSEGDGIDSNGEIHINGGYVISYAHNISDGGVDADGGIYLNGGYVAAFGGRNDATEEASKQNFMQLTYASSRSDAVTIMTKDGETPVFSVVPTRAYTDVTVSVPQLSQNTTYYVVNGGTVGGSVLKGEMYDPSGLSVKNATQMQYTSAGTSSDSMGGGMPGGDMGGGTPPSDMDTSDRPEMPSGDNSQMTPPDNTDTSNRPEMPSGDDSQMTPPDNADTSDRPEMPSGDNSQMTPPDGENNGNMGGQTTVSGDGSTDFTLTSSTYVFTGVSEAATKTWSGDTSSTKQYVTFKINGEDNTIADGSSITLSYTGAYTTSGTVVSGISSDDIIFTVRDNPSESYMASAALTELMSGGSFDASSILPTDEGSYILTISVSSGNTAYTGTSQWKFNVTESAADSSENTTVSENTTEAATEATTEAATENQTVSSETTSNTDSSDNTTTESASETTTVSSNSSSSGSSSSSSSSGGGGSSSSVKKTTTTTTTEETTETTTETSDSGNESTIKDKVTLMIGSKKIQVGDKEFDIPAVPFIQAATSSTLVPLRFAAIAINGGDVEAADESETVLWDGNTKTATVKAGDKTIQFTAGSNKMTVNGKEMPMDNGAAAQIKDGRMYIPFRALGTALGVSVEWDAQTKTASYSVIE